MEVPIGGFEIARRFCGPPRSGNGGYVAGRLAAFVDPPVSVSRSVPMSGSVSPAVPPLAVAVRLYAPPPLGRRLEVRRTSETVVLCDGADRLAEARSGTLDLSPPTAPSFAQAEVAARAFRGFDEHVFPGCFVCGPDRAEGDGLRVFPGRTDESMPFAATWIPDLSLAPGARAGDAVPAEFVWAALDCPGAFSFAQPEGRVVLLGEMQVARSGEVGFGERCVLTSWEVRTEGRKHSTGSAIYGESGDCRGVALGLWFEVDPASVPSA